MLVWIGKNAVVNRHREVSYQLPLPQEELTALLAKLRGAGYCCKSCSGLLRLDR